MGLYGGSSDDSTSNYSSNSGAPSAGEISALTANAGTINGTSNYLTDTDLLGSSSAINASANPITTNSGPVDASGGNGSIPLGLQNIATQGLNDALVSATDFGVGSLSDLFRNAANGTTTSAAAPSPYGQNATGGGGINPLWIAAAAALGLVLLIHFTNKA